MQAGTGALRLRGPAVLPAVVQRGVVVLPAVVQRRRLARHEDLVMLGPSSLLMLTR